MEVIPVSCKQPLPLQKMQSTIHIAKRTVKIFFEDFFIAAHTGTAIIPDKSFRP